MEWRRQGRSQGWKECERLTNKPQRWGKRTPGNIQLKKLKLWTWKYQPWPGTETNLPGHAACIGAVLLRRTTCCLLGRVSPWLPIQCYRWLKEFPQRRHGSGQFYRQASQDSRNREFQSCSLSECVKGDPRLPLTSFMRAGDLSWVTQGREQFNSSLDYGCKVLNY